ncbi:ATP-dependent nuclease [Aliarcobacter skirrowii]|uniref:AAA family ATPase n=1 Tax=Aliarcobacter skirrowii TaxID=28200 RepID=A0AAW9DAF2_9BACT|nr:AAA family ATPase [Aliarcobacter skirrowii]MDX4069248.1 AAA family ATPase [Aliarcobacter skirrowii]
MILKKIEIKNFKSIKEIDFEIKKHGDSYTNFLLGVNEAGKSNILQAISFMDTPKEKFNFSILHNQKIEDEEIVNLDFHLEFEKDEAYLDDIRKLCLNGNLLDFEIKNIHKNIFLEKSKNIFDEYYYFDVNINSNVYIKMNSSKKIEIAKDNDVISSFELLDVNNFEIYFGTILYNILNKYEPKASYWKPSDEYLISSSIDLKTFKTNINSNIPLKNIFVLSNYDTQEKISAKIDEILLSDKKRSKLQSELTDNTTEYIKNIWKHSISFLIEISETGNLTIFVKDDGKNNKHERYSMSDRSEGFKQFISLILSLSIETKKNNQSKRLIIIDEPENHLHPSGIRDLSKELISIGKNNYLFVSTHSPYMIDHKHKERHIIIKKDSHANTIKKEIREEIDLRDDEVLSQAFGMNVYKDLLNTKRLLLEGASDKIILSKAFKANELDYGITNGKGSNIVNIASLFNDEDISILVIVDDDDDGMKYKEDILKIKGVYNNNNVFTLRDLVGDIVPKGTIEDCLGKNYIQSKFNSEFKIKFDKDSDLELKEDEPFMSQIKLYLQRDKIDKNEINAFIEDLKIVISEDIEIKGTTLNTRFPLLDQLVSKIKEKI